MLFKIAFVTAVFFDIFFNLFLKLNLLASAFCHSIQNDSFGTLLPCLRLIVTSQIYRSSRRFLFLAINALVLRLHFKLVRIAAVGRYERNIVYLRMDTFFEIVIFDLL